MRQPGQEDSQSLHGRGTFTRFKNQSYERNPELISSWHAFRDVRGPPGRRAAGPPSGLSAQGLIQDEAAQQFATDHPDPELP